MFSFDSSLKNGQWETNIVLVVGKNALTKKIIPWRGQHWALSIEFDTCGLYKAYINFTTSTCWTLYDNHILLHLCWSSCCFSVFVFIKRRDIETDAMWLIITIDVNFCNTLRNFCTCQWVFWPTPQEQTSPAVSGLKASVSTLIFLTLSTNGQYDLDHGYSEYLYSLNISSYPAQTQVALCQMQQTVTTPPPYFTLRSVVLLECFSFGSVNIEMTGLVTKKLQFCPSYLLFSPLSLKKWRMMRFGIPLFLVLNTYIYI